MSLITRTYTFTDGTVAYGSQVDSEIANIVNTLNSLDQGNTTWTNIKVTTLLPQADVNAGGHKITNLGTPGSSGDAAVYPITASQITAGTITTTQIAASTIVSSNIASSTITRANLASVGMQLSSSCGTFTTTSSTYVDVTNLSVTITVTGRPVFIGLQSNASGVAFIGTQSSNNTTALANFQILRGATQVTEISVKAASNSTVTSVQNQVPPSSLFVFDSPAAGTYTYKVQALATFSSNTTLASNCQLVAYELA